MSFFIKQIYALCFSAKKSSTFYGIKANYGIEAKKGFTLIELLVVIIVIGIVSAVLLSAKSGEEERLSLQRAAFKLGQDIREIQETAMAAVESSCPKAGIYDYGISFQKITSPNSYIVFADCNGNEKKDSSDVEIKTIRIEKGVFISDLTIKVISPSSKKSVNTLDILFSPPEPTIYIETQSWNREVDITLQHNTDVKKVKLNSVGRIEIE
jgi:prepilin-type N-terminal cleavage/methylation domain-containing protein